MAYANAGAAPTYLDQYRPRDTTRCALALLPWSIESSGGVLIRWRDESGYRRHGTPTGSPAVSTSSGVPCVAFDGVNDRVDGALSAVGGAGTFPDQPCTVFLLRRNADTSAGGRKWVFEATDTGAAGRAISVITAFGSVAGRQEVLGDAGNVSATTSTALEVVRVDFTTCSRQLFVNGAWKASSGYPGSVARALTAYRLGLRLDGGFPWAGDLCAVLVYSGNMTQKEKERVEGSLMDLAGIARPFRWEDVPLVSSGVDPRIILPDLVPCIAGRPVRIGKWNSIYWTGRHPDMTLSGDLPLDRAPSRYWKVTPPAVGDYAFTLTAGAYSKSFILRAVNLPAPGSPKRRVLCVGDSRTNRGDEGWIQYLGDELGPDLIELVGHLPAHAGYSYPYYGVDSKKWSDFDDPAFSAFYNGGVLDIAHYRSLLANDPTDILWSLGQNDVYVLNSSTLEAGITAAFGHADNLLGAWTASLPGVRHHLAFNWPLALDPALFGGAANRDNIHALVHRYAERLQATYGGREAENIYLVPRTYTEVDVLKGVEGDGIHENRAPGHNALFEAYLAALALYAW